MIKIFFKKKIILIFLTFACLVLLILFFYKNIISYDSKKNIRKSIVFKITYLKDKVFSKSDVLYRQQKKFPNTFLINLNFNKIRIKDHYDFLNSGRKASGYIDIYENKLIFASGNGKIKFYEISNLLKGQDFYEEIIIQSNLKDIITDKYFYDSSYKTPVKMKVSINDILVDEDYLYLSYVRQMNNGFYNTAIIKAKINNNYLKFTNFFNYSEGLNSKSKNFNAQASGGRMAVYYHSDNRKKIVFTIGTFLEGNNLSQNDDSYFGKIILVDAETKEAIKFAKGFRNPQGLLVLNNRIISTDHGDQGGDEINLIKEGFNYGWPIASYGEPYDYDYSDNLKYNKKHNKFEEPLFSFVPSIAPSQIIYLPNDFNIKWTDNFLLTSLNGESIFRINLSKNFSRVISMERMIVGERIRDIVYDKNNKAIFLVLEESASIGIIRN